ncbi:MAG: hypothetical protein HY718_20675 [Planctomycetes bacterium]|nr:hypothetical protein [Planctomycetota bacterium]
MSNQPERCKWIGLRDALREFALAAHGTTSQRHIKPLHWYVACRLCLEGGFHPDEITPRPPFKVHESGAGANLRRLIEHDPEAGGSGEQTILGGLKTKQVDVVVTKKDIGPVIAVSMKGTLNALRNLTNRLEEAGGDCTNIHMTYPSLVYAYWGVIRANRPGRLSPDAPALLKTADGLMRPNDVAIADNGRPSPLVVKYHLALSGLAGRGGIRNEISKYEAVALTLVNVDSDCIGEVMEDYPPADSPLRLEALIPRIYKLYDLRFVYQAPDLRLQTGRRGWHEDSPALQQWHTKEYEPRAQAAEGNGD